MVKIPTTTGIGVQEEYQILLGQYYRFPLYFPLLEDLLRT